MTIYTIDNPLSDDGRNKINNNFEELKKDITNAVDTISNKAFYQVVDNAKINWKEPVESLANLPSPASEGDTRMTRNTGKVWRYDGQLWREIQQIDAGPVNEVDSRLTAELATMMTQTEFDSWVATLLDGGPSIFKETYNQLKTDLPDGAAGVALVRETDPSRIYIWNPIVKEWEDYGAYQGMEPKDGVVTPRKLDRLYQKASTKDVIALEATLNDVEKDNICYVKTAEETTVYSHGKNLQKFEVMSYTPSGGVFIADEIGEDYVIATVQAGQQYRGINLVKTFLKAGTYVFHREFEVLSGAGTGNIGFCYISNGTSNVTSIQLGYTSQKHTITQDGFYHFTLYANMNGTVTEDIRIKFFNIQIEKAEDFTTYEKFKGEILKGSNLIFNTFENMKLYNSDNQEMLVTYPVADNLAERLEQLEEIINPDSSNGSQMIVCDGDSLTVSTGSSNGKPSTDTNNDTSYPAVLGRKLGSGHNVINMGVGGETSWMIAARQGGMPVKVLPNTIPADKTTVRVYLKGMEQDYFYDNTTSKWTYSKNNLSYNIAVDGKTGVNPCYINGIEGTLTRQLISSGQPDPTTGETVQTNTYAYYFTRSVAGMQSTFTTPVDLVTYAAKNYKNAIHVIWMGQNDAPLHNGSYINQPGVENRAKAMVDHLNHNNYIIMMHPSGNDVGNAQAVQSFTQLFGKHFLNIRSYIAKYGVQIANEMGAGITITTEDQALIDAGQIPSCLRIDGVHGNYWYYQIVARAVYEKGIDLGYW